MSIRSVQLGKPALYGVWEQWLFFHCIPCNEVGDESIRLLSRQAMKGVISGLNLPAFFSSLIHFLSFLVLLEEVSVD